MTSHPPAYDRVTRSDELAAIDRWCAGERPAPPSPPPGGGAGGDWPPARTPPPCSPGGGGFLDFSGSFKDENGDPLPDTRRWYVAQTETGREYTARDDLERHSVETWLPEAIERSGALRRRGIVAAREPAFPGYLFVRFDHQRMQWRDIEARQGVLRLLSAKRDGTAPISIRERQMVRLRALVDEAGGTLILQGGHIQRQLTAGQNVKIDDRVPLWGGWEGLYLASSARDRIKVLLDIMGRDVPVDVDEALVWAI